MSAFFSQSHADVYLMCLKSHEIKETQNETSNRVLDCTKCVLNKTVDHQLGELYWFTKDLTDTVSILSVLPETLIVDYG